MSNAFSLILMTGLLLVSAAQAQEPVFYRVNTKIEEVDCSEKTVTLQNFYRQQLAIQGPQNKATQVCKDLQKFATEGRAITLLTVPSDVDGDAIFKVDTIGYLDIDNIVTTSSITAFDPVYTNYCGALSGNTRSSVKVCLMVSRNGRYFLELSSPQLYRLRKTSIISSQDNKISLQVMDTPTVVEMTADLEKVDDKTIKASISFEGRPAVQAVLKN